MNHRERVAQDLARKSGVTLDGYPYGSRPGPVSTDLDKLRLVQDPELRRMSWDLYWLIRAERVEHDYRFSGDQDEQDRRHP